MIDVDHFKLFNDTYGHPEGDACLSRLGETLAGLPPTPWALPDAMAARNSACCCPTPIRCGRWKIGEMVRQAVWSLAMPHTTSSFYRNVTVSVGVACTMPSDARSGRAT